MTALNWRKAVGLGGGMPGGVPPTVMQEVVLLQFNLAHTGITWAQEAGGAHRAAKGAGDRGAEGPGGAAALRAAGAVARAGLMPARDRVTGAAQVLREILFHLRCGLVGHRVQLRI
jgi:hypothetical protein